MKPTMFLKPGEKFSFEKRDFKVNSVDHFHRTVWIETTTGTLITTHESEAVETRN